MEKTSDEEELSRLAYEAQAYQQQGEVLRRQLSAVSMKIAEIEGSVEALRKLGSKKNLFHMGSGVYVKVSDVDANSFLVNVGANVIVAKTKEETEEFLVKKKKELEEMQDMIEKRMAETAGRLQEIDRSTRKLLEKMKDVRNSEEQDSRVR
ncbi:MAG: prefoldin subunit alpha [Candidatus Micrarchaeia archaeon]